MLADGGLDELVVGPVVAISRVEACQPQVACQLAQVHVGRETHPAQRARPHTSRRGDVQRLEHRVHAHVLAVLHRVGEVDRPSFHQDQVDLGVRHPQTLD